MRFRHLTLLIAFALSFHAEFAWAGGSDCVEMGQPSAETSHAHHAHSDHESETGEQDRAPECPTPTHHIAACSVLGVAATMASTADDPSAGHSDVFLIEYLLDRLPASIPSPPPWV